MSLRPWPLLRCSRVCRPLQPWRQGTAAWPSTATYPLAVPPLPWIRAARIAARPSDRPPIASGCQDVDSRTEVGVARDEVAVEVEHRDLPDDGGRAEGDAQDGAVGESAKHDVILSD